MIMHYYKRNYSGPVSNPNLPYLILPSDVTFVRRKDKTKNFCPNLMFFNQMVASGFRKATEPELFRVWGAWRQGH